MHKNILVDVDNLQIGPSPWTRWVVHWGWVCSFEMTGNPVVTLAPSKHNVNQKPQGVRTMFLGLSGLLHLPMPVGILYQSPAYIYLLF